MDPGTLVALIIGVIGIAITVVIWMASTRAVSTQVTQQDPGSYFRSVDNDAWGRAKTIYEGTIDQLEREVQRQGSQLTDQNDEIIRLNRENIRLRRRSQANGDDSGPMPKVT
jgi:hypothetical protein